MEVILSEDGVLKIENDLGKFSSCNKFTGQETLDVVIINEAAGIHQFKDIS